MPTQLAWVWPGIGFRPNALVGMRGSEHWSRGGGAGNVIPHPAPKLRAQSPRTADQAHLFLTHSPPGRGEEFVQLLGRALLASCQARLLNYNWAHGRRVSWRQPRATAHTLTHTHTPHTRMFQVPRCSGARVPRRLGAGTWPQCPMRSTVRMQRVGWPGWRTGNNREQGAGAPVAPAPPQKLEGGGSSLVSIQPAGERRHQRP